ncbi:MAG: hypothetical protein ACXACW_11885 [Candidatus Hodarchaeales archaeon]
MIRSEYQTLVFSLLLLLSLTFPLISTTSLDSGNFTQVQQVFKGTASDKYIFGEEMDTGDFWYPNLTITANTYTDEVRITGERSTVGTIKDSLFVETPFLSCNSFNSTISNWWPYWLDLDELNSVLYYSSFEIYLNSTFIEPITYAYRTSPPTGEWNFSWIDSFPIQAELALMSNGQRVIEGMNNQTLSIGKYFSRRIYLKYDLEGFLTDLQGSSLFSDVNDSYEHVFSWTRIELKRVSSTHDSPVFLWGIFESPTYVFFGSGLLVPLIMIIVFTIKKQRDK